MANKKIETNEVPINDKERKPTVKKSFSLDDFKKKIGGEDIPQKELRWLNISKALKEQIGLTIPIGYTTLIRGFSNTSKSSLLSLSIVEAQKNNIFPIIIDTENNLGRKRLKLMGFDFDNDFFLFIDNDFLLEKFGKKQDPKRNEAAIEDMAACINYFLDLQENGELPFDLLFAIDSFGSLDCIKSINAAEKGSGENNMYNANAFEKSMKYLLNNRLPSSRKINKPYTNTLIATQKIWLDSMQGAGVIKHKGGEAGFYGCRLGIHCGGTLTHGTKKLISTSKNRDLTWGIETKISIFKNQLDSELGGIAMEGKIISTPHGIIGATPEDINSYKKEHILFFREILGGEIDVDDINTNYEEIKSDEKIEFVNIMDDDN